MEAAFMVFRVLALVVGAGLFVFVAVGVITKLVLLLVKTRFGRWLYKELDEPRK